MCKIILGWLFLMCLSACAAIEGGKYHLNQEYVSKNQDERIRYIILHYTATTERESLKILTKGKVSSHYLIGKSKHGEKPNIYQLVPDNKRAWHAGESVWNGRTNINDTSIGIEMVNSGCMLDEHIVFCEPFQAEQIKALISLLKRLVKKYHIPKENILAHSDIAPNRKIDPGPLFPWKQLAQAGLVIWPDESKVKEILKDSKFYSEINLYSLQKLLKKYGYSDIPQTGVLDEKTWVTIRAFQMHFRNRDISGNLDAETLAIIKVLLKDLNNV